jgi:hypothetical protein
MYLKSGARIIIFVFIQISVRFQLQMIQTFTVVRELNRKSQIDSILAFMVAVLCEVYEKWYGREI